MALTDYVTLGNSGLRVSPMCLGTMTFGEDLGWGSSEADSNAILGRYLELGGNFVDTANAYTLGHSEAIIGEHLSRTGKRDSVVLATKFFSNASHPFRSDPNGGGTGAKSLYGAVHQSLRRLKTDYIDLLWMHAWDRHTPIEETMRALDDLVRAGKIRYVGFSDTPAWKVAQAQTMAQFRGWSPLVALQIEYSLLERTVENELVPMALALGLGITPWSPLKGGVLSGKYTRANAGTQKADRMTVSPNLTEKAYVLVDALIAIGKELGATPARVALAWVQKRPGVTSTIIGARTLEQLDQNLGSLGVTLTAQQRSRLDELSQPELAFPMKFLMAMAGSFMHGGISVNGETPAPIPYAGTANAKRY